MASNYVSPSDRQPERLATCAQLIHATFDIFDTEPKTWQLDFDEFCHWLETGERVLNSYGISNHPKSRGWVGNAAASESKGAVIP